MPPHSLTNAIGHHGETFGHINSHFEAHTDGETFLARNVVLATGPYKMTEGSSCVRPAPEPRTSLGTGGPSVRCLLLGPFRAS